MADAPERSPNALKLLAELRAPLEAATLVPMLPVLLRAPKGDGHTVVVIPPFGGVLRRFAQTGPFRRERRR